MTSRLAAVDVGNSAIKLGLFAPGDGLALPSPLHVLENTSPEEVVAACNQFAAERLAWRVASVNRPAAARLEQCIQQHRTNDDFRLLQCGDLPLTVDLPNPERVGMDRLAAVVAINQLRSADRPAIVVDAGTAITVDAVSAAGVFLGGAILPGLSLSAAALATHTDQLPHVQTDWEEEPAAIGKSTEQAIRSGAFWGSVGAVRTLIDQMEQELGVAPQVFVAGGDMRRIARLIHPQAEPAAHLVIRGIAAACRF